LLFLGEFEDKGSEPGSARNIPWQGTLQPIEIILFIYFSIILANYLPKTVILMIKMRQRTIAEGRNFMFSLGLEKIFERICQPGGPHENIYLITVVYFDRPGCSSWKRRM
jgi:hypothetical protein